MSKQGPTWRQVAEHFFRLPKNQQSEQNMAQMFEDAHHARAGRNLARIRDLEIALSALLDQKPNAQQAARKLLGRTS